MLEVHTMLETIKMLCLKFLNEEVSFKARDTVNSLNFYIKHNMCFFMLCFTIKMLCLTIKKLCLTIKKLCLAIKMLCLNF